MTRNTTRVLMGAAAAAALTVGAIGAAHATDPSAKWCEGVKIAAFPGGPQGGVFANNVYNGYRRRKWISGRRSPTTSRTGIPTPC